MQERAKADLSIVKTGEQVRNELDFLQNKLDCCLVIDGESLQVCKVDVLNVRLLILIIV
jgi:hypothetical protein